MPASEGRVAGLLVRPGKGAGTERRPEISLVAGGGPVGDHATRPSRGVTLLSREAWSEAVASCGAPDLPWEKRRANVLLEGLDLEGSPGRTLEVGECVLHVESGCPPCDLMEKTQPGLRKALEPGLRAGICARVVRGGTIRMGDPAVLRPGDSVEDS